MVRAMGTQVEELPDNKVRLTVEVPQADLEHAVEHATHDLAESVKVPGFRQGKVPPQVLLARIGRERIFREAVESHIGGWFLNAAAGTRIRPVAAPEYDYELPTSEDDEFSFTATVAVQPKPDVADWTQLEVPYEEPELPEGLVDQEVEALRESVAELAPVDGRAAKTGDVVVIDALDENGEGQRDLVVELGDGRLVEEIERALTGASQGERKQVEFDAADGETAKATVEVKEIKEKVLPPLDDELARAASEFDTLDELRADIERRVREVLEEEAETRFRAEAIDRLVEASKVQVGGPLVEARTRELLSGLARSLQARGIDAASYMQLTGQTPEVLEQRLRAEASMSVARELVLEAVADKLGIEVTDDEIREELKAAGETDEDIAEFIEQGGADRVRDDIRLKKALDRVAAEVKPIAPDLHEARESIWTPEKEQAQDAPKLWTPGSKE
jgi:trigger factor